MGCGAVCAAVIGLVGCGRIGFDPAVGGPGDDGSSSALCPAFATFCDDFESGDLSRWNTLTTFGEGKGRVVSSPVHSGGFAFEAQMAASSDIGTAAPEHRIPDQSTGVLAVREWINVQTPLKNFDLVLQLGEADADYVGAGGDDNGRWVVTESGSGSSTIDHTSTIEVPKPDTWTCVEVVYTLQAPSPGRVQVFVDEASVLDVDATTPATIDRVLVGGVRLDEAGFHVFVDDIVIADRRIGCQ